MSDDSTEQGAFKGEAVFQNLVAEGGNPLGRGEVKDGSFSISLGGDVNECSGSGPVAADGSFSFPVPCFPGEEYTITGTMAPNASSFTSILSSEGHPSLKLDGKATSGGS